MASTVVRLVVGWGCVAAFLLFGPAIFAAAGSAKKSLAAARRRSVTAGAMPWPVM